MDDTLQAIVTTAVQQETLGAALTAAGVDPAALAQRSQVTVSTQEPQDPNRGEQLGLAIVGTILLFISFSGYGQLVATGVVEEKSEPRGRAAARHDQALAAARREDPRSRRRRACCSW